MSGPLGLVAGLFGSVVGVGGGVLIVPAITTAVPIPQRIVTGTSLIAVLSTAAVSTYNFSQGGCVDQTAAAILGASAMLSARSARGSPRAWTATNSDDSSRTFCSVPRPSCPSKPPCSWPEKARANRRPRQTTTETEPKMKTERPRPRPRPVAEARKTRRSTRRLRRRNSPPSASSPASPPACSASAAVPSSLLSSRSSRLCRRRPCSERPSSRCFPRARWRPQQHHRLGNVDPRRMGLTLAAGTAVGGALGSGLAVDAPRGALEAAFFAGMLFLSKRTFATLRPKPKVGTK